MFVLPEFSPYIFKIGNIGPTWYGMMYVVGFLIGYRLALSFSKKDKNWSEKDISDLLTFIFLGVILGGRVGYVLFYQLSYFLQNPFYLFKIYEGGMSFHGGLLGVIFSMFLFKNSRKKTFLEVTDFISPLIPIGLFFGRIGNFINAELWGKETDYWFGVVFKGAGEHARHPTQLYEAFLEGFILFLILIFLKSKSPKRGVLTGSFLIGYGVFRFLVEFLRIPDEQLGYIAFSWLTTGQLLSLPMIFLGCYFLLIKKSIK